MKHEPQRILHTVDFKAAQAIIIAITTTTTTTIAKHDYGKSIKLTDTLSESYIQVRKLKNTKTPTGHQLLKRGKRSASAPQTTTATAIATATYYCSQRKQGREGEVISVG